MEAVTGWLLVYLIGTLPLLAFYSAGLAGWYLDYPIWLFTGILLLLSAPLVLLFLKVPSAPAWNIATLWAGAGLISMRILTGVVGADKEALKPHWMSLVSIVCVAFGWAIVWTWYFRVSQRVADTFA